MTTQPPPARVLPRPLNEELTKPFWEAARRHELVLPRCRRCSRYHFYPRELCPHCLSDQLEWVPATGQARLYSYTIVHQPPHPSFEVPYVYAIVQLAEGVMLPSNVVECDLSDLRIDMPLTPVFDDASPEWTLVKFKRA
ncbi:MAG TPA: Zn-ribbon domain-containing OB-fold protein [Dehalococcoidia bacterium]|nr:Zn-ribbon domain-containing OB-fold protein [Dehalococcoidia bacterium]